MSVRDETFVPPDGGQASLSTADSSRTGLVKFRMTLQYVGTAYHGWQVQANRPTIQSCLQEALFRICQERIAVIGAGRTDAGVHALGQVAHFRTGKTLPAEVLRRALNALLPWDIRVLRLSRAKPGFHAQRDALRKRYEYRIYSGPVLSPFLSRRALHVPGGLDFEAMERSVACLVGKHDFSAYTAAASKVADKERVVFAAEFRRTGHRLDFRITGDGFLHHMVRNIVGTALEIGKGKRKTNEMKEILDSRDRRNAGPTAPAHGLYLCRIWYR